MHDEDNIAPPMQTDWVASFAALTEDAAKSADVEQSVATVLSGIADLVERAHNDDDTHALAAVLRSSTRAAYAAIVHGTSAQGVMPAQP